MNWWDILEISYDSDIKTIKKAYAKLLKIHNPEDDAEGYQRLREAYDKAIKCAKKNKENILNKESDNSISKSTNYQLNIVEDVDIVEDDVNSEEIIISKDNTKNYEKSEENNANIEEQIEEFSNRLNSIYMDKSLLIDVYEWDKLLNMDAVWNVHSFQIIEDKMIRFLLETKNLPVMIWVKLDKYFNWSKNEVDLYKKYDRKYVDEFIKILRNCNKVKCYNTNKFRYEYLKLINAKFIDEYLNLRENAYESLNNNKFYEAKEYLFFAYKIFKNDPILLSFIAEFYFKINDIDNSLKFYKTAFKIDNANLDLALSIGNILSMKQSYEEAIPYLDFYLSKDTNAKALYNLGIGYYYTDNLSLAKENFIKFLEIYPRNRSAKKYLNNTEERLKGSQVKIIKAKEYKAPMKKIVKKEIQHKKSEFLSKRISSVLIIFFMMVILLALAINFKNNNLEDKKFIAVNEVNEFRNMDYNTNLKVKLNDIKDTKYYKISEAFKDENIVSEEIIKDNNLSYKIEGKIYIGMLKGAIIIFSSEKPIKANDYYEYEVKGAKSNIENSTFNQIVIDFESYYKSNYFWTMGQYIDTSEKEIHKAERSSELIFKKD